MLSKPNTITAFDMTDQTLHEGSYSYTLIVILNMYIVLPNFSVEKSGEVTELTTGAETQSQSKFNLRQNRKSKFNVAFDADVETESDEDKPKNSKYRSRYHSVSNEKRLKLISLVIEQGKKIKLVIN